MDPCAHKRDSVGGYDDHDYDVRRPSNSMDSYKHHTSIRDVLQ